MDFYHTAIIIIWICILVQHIWDTCDILLCTEDFPILIMMDIGNWAMYCHRHNRCTDAVL